jgi:hypothetical protein
MVSTPTIHPTGYVTGPGHRGAALACRWVVVIVADRLRTVSIICGMDGRAHEVTEQDVAAGRRLGNRQYRAACGYQFMLPAPLVALAGRSCARCAAVLAGRRRPC